MENKEAAETGQKLYKTGQFTEAIPFLKLAVDDSPNDEFLWQTLVLASHYSSQYELGVEFIKQAIHHHPLSDWLWRHLGNELTQIGRLDEAEKALNNARRLNPNAGWLWRYFIDLSRKNKRLEMEIEALEKLHSLGETTWTDLNELGIAYYKDKNFAKALEYYRLSTKKELRVYPFYNMGLVFNNPEVSQDSDAADAYRRALKLKPDYESAQKELETTKKKLLPLGELAIKESLNLFQTSDMFQFYLNPFEVLQIETVNSVEELDNKFIQDAKNKLLREITINDSKIEWLADYQLDKSHALEIVDELYDKTKCGYHLAIFKNKQLLSFLTRCDIQHFIYSDSYFPYETLELQDNDPGFRSFLSKPFAKQYNFVLSRAIENRLLSMIEVLFDGRRWIEPEDEEICFEGTLRYIQVLVERLEDMDRRSQEIKITVSEIEQLLSDLSVIEIFNLLPTTFRNEQNRLVTAIRSIAINNHNIHNDSDMSSAILDICERFQFKSVDLNKRLKDDRKAIKEILKDKQKQKIFAGIKPIKAAPSLHTINGIGFTLYGSEDYDKDTYSFVSTYFFVFFAIPIFPIRRYRVSQTKDGYRFYGSLPLSPANKLHLFISIILILLFSVYLYSEAISTSSSGSYSSSGSSTYSQPSNNRTSTSESKTVYSIPSYISSELERDEKNIEDEEAKLKNMENELKRLDNTIERERLLLSHASQMAIDAYNRKIDQYNRLLKQTQEQNRLVNQLIDDYNTKLRKYGR